MKSSKPPAASAIPSFLLGIMLVWAGTSCNKTREYDAKVEFYKAQGRDVNVLGSYIDPEDAEDYPLPVYTYKSDGSIIWELYYDDEVIRVYEIEKYWYTSEDSLYELTAYISPDEIKLAEFGTTYRMSEELDTLYYQFGASEGVKVKY